MQGKVDPAWIPCIFEHGGKRSGEAELLIGVFEQNQPSIGRQEASIEVEVNGFVPDWCQVKGGCHLGLHRIDTEHRVCWGGIRVHGGSPLCLGGLNFLLW